MPFDLDVAIHGVPYYSERGWRDKGRQRSSASLNFGEDAWALRVRQHEPSILIGVADGVSAWSNEGYNPAIVSAEILRAAVEEGELSLDLRTNLRRAQERVTAEGIVGAGTCTVTMVSVSPGAKTLSALVLGDSFPGLWRPNKGFQWLVSPIAGRNPHGVPNQIGVVPADLAREKFYVAGEASEAEVISDVPLEPGTVIVIGSDGLWDNLLPPRSREGLRGFLAHKTLAEVAALWEERAQLVDIFITETIRAAADGTLAIATTGSPQQPQQEKLPERTSLPLTPLQQHRPRLSLETAPGQHLQPPPQSSVLFGAESSPPPPNALSRSLTPPLSPEQPPSPRLAQQQQQPQPSALSPATSETAATKRKPSLAEAIANVLVQEAKRGMLNGGKPDDVTCCVCICLPKGSTTAPGGGISAMLASGGTSGAGAGSETTAPADMSIDPVVPELAAAPASAGYQESDKEAQHRKQTLAYA